MFLYKKTKKSTAFLHKKKQTEASKQKAGFFQAGLYFGMLFSTKGTQIKGKDWRE